MYCIIYKLFIRWFQYYALKPLEMDCLIMLVTKLKPRNAKSTTLGRVSQMICVCEVSLNTINCFKVLALRSI